jgi:phosphopantetheinyl transferase (holo-ACP synthase)
MVGNDVVDLADREVRPEATHPRFDARVFARRERQALGASGAPNRLRWMLWAAKEAAYKLARKRNPRVVFSPSRFVVGLDARLTGEVIHEDERFAIRVCSSGDALHAIAMDGAEESLVTGLEPAPDALDAGAAVRALAVRTLAARLRAPARTIRIERRGRIPTLEVPGLAPIDLSLSHHGRFVAFACDLGELRA